MSPNLDNPATEKPMWSGATRTGNYLKGLSSGYVATVASMLVGLWLTPFALRILGREEFAIFTLASDALAWLALLDLGISAGVRMQAAQLTGRPDQERLNRLASTAFFAELVAVGAVIVVGGCISLVLPEFFGVSPALRTDAGWVFFLMTIGAGITIAGQTFSGLLIAHQQIHIDNLLRIVLLLLRTTLAVLLLVAGWRLYAIAFASLAATIVTTAVAVARCYRLLPGLQVRPQLASLAELKQTGAMGLWFSLGGLAGILIQGLDRAVSARVVSIASVTTLSLTGRLYYLAFGVLGQLTNTARPALGQLLGKGETKAALFAYSRIARVSTAVSLVVALGVFAGNRAFVGWWVGEANYGGVWLDLALACNLIVNCWILPNRATLAAGLVVKQNSLSRVVEGVLNLGISVALGIWLGLPGVVGGTTVACLVSSFWYLPLLTSRMFDISFKELVAKEGIRLVLPALLVAGCALGARNLAARGAGPVAATAAMLGTAGIASALLWGLGFSRESRADLKTLLRSSTAWV